MALKVKAKERLLKVGKYANTYRYDAVSEYADLQPTL